MNNIDLKQGDVIAITWGKHNTLAIFDKFDKTFGNQDGLHIYAEMDILTNELYFKTEDCEFSYELEDITYRLATEEEKCTLYNAIGKYFTEEHDKDWYNHFTDSAYFDVQDFLLDMFCIKVEEYDNDMIYPNFVDEIHHYIWEKLCKSMGYKNYDGDEFVEQLVNKQEFIEKVRNWLEQHAYDDKYWTSEGDDLYLGNLIGDICKYLEE